MKRGRRYITDFLYSTPTFLSGAGTVLSMFGGYFEYNMSESSCNADSRAIENDFRMVGQDINDSLFDFEEDIEKPV